MNEKIAGILRLGAEPEQYAAQYIEELRAENAALQRQLNESRKSRIEPAPPFKPGERVYTFTYDDDEEPVYIDSRPRPTDYASYIFLGGNDRYAFLSPVVNDERDYLKLSEYYYAEYIRNENSCDCIIVPYSKCFRSKQEVKAALKKL